MSRRQDSISRRKFMALAGASVATPAFLSACGDSNPDSSSASSNDETSAFGDGDVGILNFLLALEYAQVDFYEGLTSSNLFNAAARKALGKFGEEEEEHVSILSKEIEKLGGDLVAKPKSKFDLSSESAALSTASELENLGAGAYRGQLPRVESDAVLGPLLSIHSVEGRHAAAINDLQAKPITPDGAFAKPVSVKRITIAFPFLSIS